MLNAIAVIVRVNSETFKSELDGVPAVVKDHIHVKGLTARNGLSFQNDISKSSNNDIRLKALV